MIKSLNEYLKRTKEKRYCDQRPYGPMSYVQIESGMRKRQRTTFPANPRTLQQATDAFKTSDDNPTYQEYVRNYVGKRTDSQGHVALMFMDNSRETLDSFRGYSGAIYLDGNPEKVFCNGKS